MKRQNILLMKVNRKHFHCWEPRTQTPPKKELKKSQRNKSNTLHLMIHCVVSYYTFSSSLLGMGRRTSGMRISTRPWYRLLSQSRLQRSTGSYLHSKTRQDLGRRFSDSSWLIHTHACRVFSTHISHQIVIFLQTNGFLRFLKQEQNFELLALTQLMLHLQPDFGWTSRRSSKEFPPE